MKPDYLLFDERERERERERRERERERGGVFRIRRAQTMKIEK